MMPLLSVVGKKGSGKAEVLEALIACLSKKGFRIGVIKDLARDDIEIDEPGKDTYRYRTQGAETVILAGKKRLAIFSNLREETSLENLLKVFQGFDLVMLEGYFLDEIPKIEVHKRELGISPLAGRMKNIFAICSDRQTCFDIPHFYFSQMNELAALIEEGLLSSKFAFIGRESK